MATIESFRQFRKEASKVALKGAIATALAVGVPTVIERVHNTQAFPTGTDMDLIACSGDNKPVDTIPIEGNEYTLQAWNCTYKGEYIILVANRPLPRGVYMDSLGGGFYADKNAKGFFRETRTDSTGVHFDLEEGKFANIHMDPPAQR